MFLFTYCFNLDFCIFAFASFVQVYCSRASAGTLELEPLNIIYCTCTCFVCFFVFFLSLFLLCAYTRLVTN